MDWNYLFTSFSGRINRQPFWLSVLAIAVIQIVVSLVTGLLDAMLHTPRIGVSDISAGVGILSLIVGIVVGIAIIWASLAVQVKRWHDRDKSGWWVLISLVPIIGAIWALIETGFLRGTPGPNKYGPDPLGGGA